MRSRRTITRYPHLQWFDAEKRFVNRQITTWESNQPFDVRNPRACDARVRWWREESRATLLNNALRAHGTTTTGAVALSNALKILHLQVGNI